MTDTEKGAMTLEEYGNKLINDDLGKLVESNPYFAFIVLASAIEFVARCRSQLENFHDQNDTRERYIEAINNLNAFASYRQFNYNNGQNNKLYSALRCGLLHTTIPDKDITLSSKENESPNVVGCISLYEDVKKAWAEIKSDATILRHLQTHNGPVISETLPSNAEEK